MLTKHDYKNAVNSQSAVNSSGLILAMSEFIGKALQSPDYTGTGWLNKHPIMTLYIVQLGYLNNPEEPFFPSNYSEVYQFCISCSLGESGSFVKNENTYQFSGEE